MNARVDYLLGEALGLPTDQRSALVVALIDSLEAVDDPSLTEVWWSEIMRRRADLRAGIVNTVSWTEAKARLSSL
ncbi:MAG: addiction module protein [Burkholderiaceae bacterium]|nr:addiction module protein [Burkholderiaceae bacterium]